jgi:hypothetical protein
VELLVLVVLELAEDGAAAEADGATAEEDAEVGAEEEAIAPNPGRAIRNGLRGTGADDVEIASINMVYTSGKETTKEIIGSIATLKTEEAPKLHFCRRSES